jgi:hypothetical protein
MEDAKTQQNKIEYSINLPGTMIDMKSDDLDASINIGVRSDGRAKDTTNESLKEMSSKEVRNIEYFGQILEMEQIQVRARSKEINIIPSVSTANNSSID